jgi:hypothetical protein
VRPPRWPAVAFGAASALYSSWLLGPWLNPRLGLRTGLASDLAAADQPWHDLFRYCDVAAGSLALLGSARMLLGGRRDRRPRWHRISAAERAAWLFVALFAVSTICDGSLTALPCAPSIDAGCPDYLAGSPADVVFDPHTLTSAFAVIGGIGSIVSFWRAARAGSGDRTWAAGLAVGSLAVNVGLLVELARDGAHEGIWQRIELVNLAACLVYTAVRSQQPDCRPEFAAETPNAARRPGCYA